MKIGIIDYDAGNLASVRTAVEHLGFSYLVAQKPEELKGIDKIIFPGVGEASSAMAALKERGFDEYLKSFAAKGNPLLAICIGSQIILDSSEEGDAECLGLLPGKTVRFPQDHTQKVPHMGWNQVRAKQGSVIFQGIPDNSSFYFVHSYYPSPADESLIIAESDYDMAFCCALGKDNIIATQFHPEKSGPYGLKLLENFAEKFG